MGAGLGPFKGNYILYSLAFSGVARKVKADG